MEIHDVQNGATVRGPYDRDPETQERTERDGAFLDDGVVLGTIQSGSGAFVVVREGDGIATTLVPLGEVVDNWDLVRPLETPVAAQQREQRESDLDRREREIRRRELEVQQAAKDQQPQQPEPATQPQT